MHTVQIYKKYLFDCKQPVVEVQRLNLYGRFWSKPGGA